MISDFKMKIHQFDIGWRSAQTPPGELNTALPDL